MRRTGTGFTLIELIMVIVILGILAAVAIPLYVDYQDEAEIAAGRGVVGGVRAGIMTYYMQKINGKPQRTYPTDLDTEGWTGLCSSANGPCFNVVLQQGGIASDDWSKTTDTLAGVDTYTYLSGETNESVYDYDPSDGSFIKQP